MFAFFQHVLRCFFSGCHEIRLAKIEGFMKKAAVVYIKCRGVWAYPIYMFIGAFPKVLGAVIWSFLI